MAWSPGQYLKFEDERTRPARDLLSGVPLTAPARVVDLGCGPGNSTELLVARYPGAAVSGIDSSPGMVAAAGKRLPNLDFAVADLSTWVPEAAPDLLYANAVMQWVPDHATALPRLMGLLAPGGALAIQMPDNMEEPSHVLMRQAARACRAAAKLAPALASRETLGTIAWYYDLLRPLSSKVEIWRTTYNHPLAGPGAIVEWFKGTALGPYLQLLDAGEAADYLALYQAAIAEAYPPRVDGTSLLAFPRLFIVAVG